MGSESTTFLYEALDLISSTTVLGVLYGITFSLYCHCAWLLYHKLQNPDKKYQARFSLGYTTLLFLCATGILVVSTRQIKVAYINHADFPGGPLEYEQSDYGDSATNSFFAAGGILDFLIEISTMAIQIRRLWIIWSGRRYAVAVIFLPVLLLLCYLALEIPTNLITSFVSFDQLGISNTSARAMVTATYAIMPSFTVLVTSLIAARLLLVRRQHAKLMGMSETASPYLSIITMLVESYFLESAWSLATAISFALNSPSLYLFLAGDSTVKIIAYFLIIYRVETGRGWTRKTERRLTSLQWNRGEETPTDKTSSVWSPASANAPVLTINSLPANHSESAV